MKKFFKIFALAAILCVCVIAPVACIDGSV